MALAVLVGSVIRHVIPLAAYEITKSILLQGERCDFEFDLPAVYTSLHLGRCRNLLGRRPQVPCIDLHCSRAIRDLGLLQFIMEQNHVHAQSHCQTQFAFIRFGIVERCSIVDMDSAGSR